MDEDSSDADPPAVRENMVSNAVRFLQNPKVRESTFAQRQSFLAKKGLTAKEIELAVERSGTAGDAQLPAPSAVTAAPHSGPIVYAAPPQDLSPWARWRDHTATALVIGGVSYGLYQLIKKYILPIWLGPSEEDRRAKALQTKITELETNMSSAVASLSEIQTTFKEQQEQLRQLVLNTAAGRGPAELDRMQSQQGVTEIKTEIQSLKGLLLSRKQFPPTPRSTPVIPAWQLGNGQSNTDATTLTKSANSKTDSADLSPVSVSPVQTVAAAEAPSEAPSEAPTDTAPIPTLHTSDTDNDTDDKQLQAEKKEEIEAVEVEPEETGLSNSLEEESVTSVMFTELSTATSTATAQLDTS